MARTKGTPLLSPESAATLVVGLIVGLIPEMEWWLRGLGVLATSVLAVHTGHRIEGSFLKKYFFPAAAIAILVAGTWLPIWNGFHQEFPGVTSETAISKIVEVFAIAICGVAGYFFLLRPRAKEGYRVLPAQVMAFGACVVFAGFFAILIGLVWQFQQNWAAGMKPTGAPVFSLVPPQITQTPVPLALPSPQQGVPQTPFFLDYNLTEAGVTALADELYKVRDALEKKIELDRMGTEGTASGFISNFIRACDRAGMDCPVSNVHPNSPDEKGFMIYVADPKKPPAPAQELQAVLLRLGIDVPFVARPGFGPVAFTLFVGPKP